MAKLVLGLGLMCAVAAVSGAPAKTYDQRQHGEMNIHAQLDNIVIVLIPTSKISLTEVPSQSEENNLVTSGSQGGKPEKNGFLQFLQKHIKNDIDRYGIIKEETLPHVENEVSSQEVVLKVEKDKEKENGEKYEEVVATVEEMKPSEAIEKTTTLPKPEATEFTPIKEHSTVSETVQETVFKVSIPEELKESAKKAQEESKKMEEDMKKAGKEADVKGLSGPVKVEPLQEKQDTEKNVNVKNYSKNKAESSTFKTESSGSQLDDLIKPVATKAPQSPSVSEGATGDSRKSSVEGVRKEKVIRYKPDSKWAPGLVDLLGPVRPRGRELEERQRFNPLCSPGAWDPELKTCIMPGETRSRNELARFLEAMRFGIALPAQ